MLTSTIVLVVVRLFCVEWFISGLSSLVLALVETSPLTSGHRHSLHFVVPALVYIAMGLIGWLVAPLIARLIVRSQNTPVSIPSASLVDLYAFAFVFLGLYFVVSSLGLALNWFYYFFISAATLGDFSPERKASFFEFLRPLITILAGLACIFYGPYWGRKLVAKDNCGQTSETPIDLPKS